MMLFADIEFHFGSTSLHYEIHLFYLIFFLHDSTVSHCLALILMSVAYVSACYYR